MAMTNLAVVIVVIVNADIAETAAVFIAGATTRATTVALRGNAVIAAVSINEARTGRHGLHRK